MQHGSYTPNHKSTSIRVRTDSFSWGSQVEKCTEFGQQLFYVNLNMGGKSMGEKAACEKSAGELGVWG